ncbi:hypothetical protein ACMA1I_19955 [Pontibacter sp. 13R65]|uniref:hypothetical protein n=1 Tax=Pontibacter sp. 13R65 TaxID=3127458 RepID=UPI00301D3277
MKRSSANFCRNSEAANLLSAKMERWLAPVLTHFFKPPWKRRWNCTCEEKERQQGNRRNGKVTKQMRPSDGGIEVLCQDTEHV